MKTVTLFFTLLAVAQAAFGESTIVYSPYHYSGWLDPQPFDMNQDGTVDFTLGSRWLITMDVPPSGMGYSFEVRPTEDNYVLGFDYRAAALSEGESISFAPAGAASWRHPEYGPVTVGSWMADLRLGTWSGWAAPMTGLEETFVGLRFSAADGEHFGWARVTLGNFGTSAMAQIIDYAYEGRPDTQILAGAVPEPSAAVLLVLALAATWLFARTRVVRIAGD